jgi:hypothetical protein
MNNQLPLNSGALLSALREAPVNSAVEGTLKMRVHSRLSASLLGLTPALSASVPATSNALVALRSNGISVAKLFATGKGTLVVWLAPVFALGVLTGVAADRWHQHSASKSLPHIAAPVTQQDPLLSPQPEPPLQALLPSDLEQIDSPSVAAAPSLAMPSPTASDANSSLAIERRLLDEARQALARGEPQSGLAPLDRHAKRFPKGVLTEEREALAVRLLAALGQSDAATARAENFHRRFPNSLFTPAVDNAIATISRRNGAGESKP